MSPSRWTRPRLRWYRNLTAGASAELVGEHGAGTGLAEFAIGQLIGLAVDAIRGGGMPQFDIKPGLDAPVGLIGIATILVIPMIAVIIQDRRKK